MAANPDAPSVLVVHDSPQILVFLARLFPNSGMRALLAHDWVEAVGIAERDYVPIDFVLTDVAMPAPDAARLMSRLHEIRPAVRALYMAARVDCEAIRVKLLSGAADPYVVVDGGSAEGRGLIEWLRSASAAPLVRRAGSHGGGVN